MVLNALASCVVRASSTAVLTMWHWGFTAFYQCSCTISKSRCNTRLQIYFKFLKKYQHGRKLHHYSITKDHRKCVMYDVFDSEFCTNALCNQRWCSYLFLTTRMAYGSYKCLDWCLSSDPFFKDFFKMLNRQSAVSEYCSQKRDGEWDICCGWILFLAMAWWRQSNSNFLDQCWIQWVKDSYHGTPTYEAT